VRVSAEHLKTVIVAFLMSFGAQEVEAKLVADNLVAAELRGISTHGINFIPMIAERIDHGLLKVPTRIEVISDDEAVTHIDGGNGLGQVAATEATRKAIEKARKFGVGISLVRNTNHVGLLAFYTKMAASQGMIGICMCNSAAAMAPWGGAEPFFGTNPLSIAAPSGTGSPIILDMSTSIVARGKIRKAVKTKQSIPMGWALDAAGAPTDDPVAAMEGTLLPIGGPKGYGLAFFVDLISGLLSGSKYSREVSTFHQPLSPTGVGVMTMAIDTARFMPRPIFDALVSEHVRAIQESPKARNCSRIYLPGEIEAEREKLGLQQGIQIDENVLESVDRLLSVRGVDLRLSDLAVAE